MVQERQTNADREELGCSVISGKLYILFGLNGNIVGAQKPTTHKKSMPLNSLENQHLKTKIPQVLGQNIPSTSCLRSIAGARVSASSIYLASVLRWLIKCCIRLST